MSYVSHRARNATISLDVWEEIMSSVLAYLGIPDPEAWEWNALCAQTDPEAFYPEKGGTTATAKAICIQCPVRTECLAMALEHDERFGVWGGLSERERRRLKRTTVRGDAA